MRVLVTGGQGIIAKAVIKRLAQNTRHSVAAVIDDECLAMKLKGSQEGLYIIPQSEWTDDICSKYHTVIHTAEIGSSYVANIEKLRKLLLSAMQGNVQRFIYLSSAEVYGNSPTRYQLEFHQPAPVTLYGAYKLMGENLALTCGRKTSMDVICLRVFTTYGAGSFPLEKLDSFSVIPKFVYCALKNEPLPIFGDGQQSRDFISVNNVASAIIETLDYEFPGGIYNISSEWATKILDLARMIGKYLNVNPSIQFLPIDGCSIRDLRGGNRKFANFAPDWKRDLGRFNEDLKSMLASGVKIETRDNNKEYLVIPDSVVPKEKEEKKGKIDT